MAGMTLHSWGTIVPAVDDVEKLLSYIKMARPALLQWKWTQILIIDEGTQCSSHKLRYTRLSFCGSVLMVDGHLFDKISAIAAQLRKTTDKPFGGIQVSPMLVSSSVDTDYSMQLVITGDFFQLPPRHQRRRATFLCICM